MKNKFLLVLAVLAVGFVGLIVYANDDYDNNDQDPYENEDHVALGEVLEYFDYLLGEAIIYYLGGRTEPYEEVLYMDVEDITVLNLNNRELLSLDGLGHLTALERLDISGNYLERLYLPDNVALVYIDASNNSLNEVELSANVYLRYLDLRGNEDLDSIDLRENILLELVDLRGTGVTEPGLPDNIVPHEDYGLLFIAQEEDDDDDYEYDRLPVNTVQVKERLFGEIDWDAVVRGDRVQDILLRVELATGPDGDWFAQWVEILDADDIALDPDEPGTLVTVFSWILVFAAVLSFILSIVLFIIRKE